MWRAGRVDGDGAELVLDRRLAVPPGKERRLPIAFTGSDVDPGRTGRIRWLVEMYPEEKDLTATLSSSVRFDVTTNAPTPPTTEPKTPETSHPTTEPKPPSSNSTPTMAPLPPVG